MAEVKEEVKTDDVKPEGTVTSPEPNKNDVKPEGTVTSPEPKEDDLDKPVIPRRRLNEALDKAKQSDEKNQLLETQLEIMRQQLETQTSVKATEETTKEMVDDYVTELGWTDDFAKKFVEKQRNLMKSEMAVPLQNLNTRTSATMSKIVLDDVISKAPYAKKYRADIEAKLNQLKDPSLKTDAGVVQDIVDLVMGKKIAEIEKEAEDRGFSRSETQRKIVGGITNERVSNATNTKKNTLSETEKDVARQMGLSEDDYIDSKEKLRQQKERSRK